MWLKIRYANITYQNKNFLSAYINIENGRRCRNGNSWCNNIDQKWKWKGYIYEKYKSDKQWRGWRKRDNVTNRRGWRKFLKEICLQTLFSVKFKQIVKPLVTIGPLNFSFYPWNQKVSLKMVLNLSTTECTLKDGGFSGQPLAFKYLTLRILQHFHQWTKSLPNIITR